MPIIMETFNLMFFLVRYCPVFKGPSVHGMNGTYTGVAWCRYLLLQLSCSCFSSFPVAETGIVFALGGQQNVLYFCPL